MLDKLKQLIPQEAKRAVKRMSRNVWDSGQYRVLCRGVKGEIPQHVIFVCKGNICRSAFAEHYFRNRLNGRLKIESCGLDVDKGVPPPLGAVQAADRFGVDLRSHQSKGLGACDIARADLILSMELWQYRRLVILFPEKKTNIRLLREFAPGPSGLLCNIFDPYGLPAKYFDACFHLIQIALNRLECQLLDENE